MKMALRLFLALALLCAGAAFAQTDLAGDWRGKLAIDANTTLPVQFVFTKKPDGSYAAVLNSLENAFIKNVTASSVSWKDGALKVEVPTLSGSYVGTLNGDHFDGQWTQAGSKPISLALSRPPQASQADVETLTGAWQGPMPGPRKVTVIFEFKPDGKGGLTGGLSVPEEGSLSIPLANLEAAAGEIAFKIPQIGGEYRGTFSGTAMAGKFKQGGALQGGAPLNLTKTNIATSQRLGLGGEAFAQLYGNWKGNVADHQTQLLFSVNGTQQVAFLNVLEQKKSLPITAVTVTGKKVMFMIDSVKGEFAGELAGNKLTGVWTAEGKSSPAAWTKQ
jgi:hypothetical protein